jgi:hypothetical protein
VPYLVSVADGATPPILILSDGMTGCVGPGVVMLQAHDRRQQTAAFSSNCWLKPIPKYFSQLNAFALPCYKIYTNFLVFIWMTFILILSQTIYCIILFIVAHFRPEYTTTVSPE